MLSTRMRNLTGPPSEMSPRWRADFRLGIRILRSRIQQRAKQSTLLWHNVPARLRGFVFRTTLRNDVDAAAAVALGQLLGFTGASGCVPIRRRFGCCEMLH